LPEKRKLQQSPNVKTTDSMPSPDRVPLQMHLLTLSVLEDQRELYATLQHVRGSTFLWEFFHAVVEVHESHFLVASVENLDLPVKERIELVERTVLHVILFLSS
jgi:hypothetical protein